MSQTTRKPDPSLLISAMPVDGKAQAHSWFRQLRDEICALFEQIECELSGSKLPPGTFERTLWDRPEGGGGEMSIMRGRVFEKVGVNISTVHSKFSEQFQKEIPGGTAYPYFWASGISLVAHMCSPLVPAVHMNTRMITLSSSPGLPTGSSVGHTKDTQPNDRGPEHNGDVKQLQWFGGGADLTPMYPDDVDTADFHGALKSACDGHDPAYYPKYKDWCDEYFYLPHRGEPRGVGGIFYDYLNHGPDKHSWQHGFDFTQDIGVAFKDIYADIVRRHMQKEWTDEQRQWQLEKRGRYVEFNLLHDRGTRFGLMTGGNTEAILMSMPPEARWP